MESIIQILSNVWHLWKFHLSDWLSFLQSMFAELTLRARNHSCVRLRIRAKFKSS